MLKLPGFSEFSNFFQSNIYIMSIIQTILRIFRVYEKESEFYGKSKRKFNKIKFLNWNTKFLNRPGHPKSQVQRQVPYNDLKIEGSLTVVAITIVNSNSNTTTGVGGGREGGGVDIRGISGDKIRLQERLGPMTRSGSISLRASARGGWGRQPPSASRKDPVGVNCGWGIWLGTRGLPATRKGLAWFWRKGSCAPRRWKDICGQNQTEIVRNNAANFKF